MTPAVEVGELLRRYGPAFLSQFGSSLSYEQKQVLRDLATCRTAALGGHVQRCGDCGHQQITYNSCRNRHCPKCQAAARAAWLAQRSAELLPVPYFHVVFTLPSVLGPLALQNKRLLYGLLFRAASETLLSVAASPKHLGARIGFLAVLHTWGQNLMHHPHLHCVVPGGGLAPDGSQWIRCRRSGKRKPFFLPVRVLSRVFRGKFIHHLKRAFAKGQLKFHGRLKDLQCPQAFERLLDDAVRHDWVVYAKRPFGGPEQVLKYLARYTHRVAISNQRLIAIDNGQVRFRYKDYAAGQQAKEMTLSAEEFIRRFLLHTLPKGFMRIRHFGFMANRHRAEMLNQCRRLLRDAERPKSEATTPNEAIDQSDADACSERCPMCRTGRLFVVELLPSSRSFRPPRPHYLNHLLAGAYDDSS